jgi:endonuclease/exonuclease/phosphatase family metal-dependent hydrolase
MRHGDIDMNTAQGLRFLRERIELANIPSSRLDETINIATWNIREFGRTSREEASIHYIAEIINQFDLIAITELRDNLGDLKRVMHLLGRYWDVVYCDYIDDPGGNDERMAFLFDKRAVVFTGLAAELDPSRVKTASGEWLSKINWWRSPYMASFSSGSFDFVMIIAHIRWGKSTKSRLGPLNLLADWINERRNSSFAVDKDIILLGDFNITSKRSSLYKAIISKGLMIPNALNKKKIGTNLSQARFYDQILHYPTHAERFTENAGVLDFYGGDEANIQKYFPDSALSKTKFTYQLSDHLPLWAQINVDLEEDELNQILND